jgi:hypothetical protein
MGEAISSSHQARVLKLALLVRVRLIQVVRKTMMKKMKTKMRKKKRKIMLILAPHTITALNLQQSLSTNTKAIQTTLSGLVNRLQILFNSRRLSMRSKCSLESRQESARSSIQTKIRFRAP